MSFTFAPKLPGDFFGPGSLPDGVTCTLQYKFASNTITKNGSGTPWAVTRVPWGGNYTLQYATSVLPGHYAQVAQNGITSLNQSLSAAQTAQTTAQALVASGQAAFDAATVELQTASTALDQAQMADTQAQTTFDTLRRRLGAGAATQAGVDAARTALQIADQAFATQDGDYNTKLQAYQTAQTTLASANATLGTAKAAVDDYTQQLTFAGLNADLAATNDANFAAMAGQPNDGANFTTGYAVASLSGPGANGAAVASNGFAQFFRTSDAYGNPTDTLYQFFIYTTAGAYRHLVNLSDGAYQQLLTSGLALALTWLEVTTTTPVETVLVSPPAPGAAYHLFVTGHSIEPTVTTEAKTETLDLSSATQLPDGSWQLASTGNAFDAPAGVGTPGAAGTSGTAPANLVSIGVSAAASLPSVASGSPQTQGADRQREGWSELFTPAGQIANRYLTITASKAPGGPANADYSGTVQLVPAPVPPALLSYPLLLLINLSDGCLPNGLYDPANFFNNPLAVPSEYGQVKDAATLILNDPPGLVFTLSNPQSAADILAEAQAVRDVDWPGYDTNGQPTGGAPESTAFPGAINYTSADGDHVIAQKMRFQLVYEANDARVLHASTFEAAFRWAYKRRNLLTGAVTMEPHSKTVTFPDVVTTTDPDTQVSTTAYNYYVADAAWTEVTAGDNESVELMLLPGENPQPHTFTGGGATLALVSADNGDGDGAS